MKTIEITLYKFEELNEQAQNFAIEKERESKEINLDFFNDDALEKINEAGFCNDVNLQYSLSNRQGDGLSFSCKHIEVRVLLKFFAEVLGKGKEKTAKIIIDNSYFNNGGNTGHYCYAHKNDIEYIFDTGINAPNIENIVEKVETKIQNHYLDLCKDLEKQGYAEIEYQYSDEYIKSELMELDYDYTEDGEKF